MINTGTKCALQSVLKTKQNNVQQIWI